MQNVAGDTIHLKVKNNKGVERLGAIQVVDQENILLKEGIFNLSLHKISNDRYLKKLEELKAEKLKLEANNNQKENEPKKSK